MALLRGGGEREPIHGVVLSARRHDIGNPLDWLKTNLIFARRDQAMWKQIEPLLRELMSDEQEATSNGQ